MCGGGGGGGGAHKPPTILGHSILDCKFKIHIKYGWVRPWQWNTHTHTHTHTPFHLVEQNREVFTRKSSFVVIFVLAGELCVVWVHLNREEDVVFGYMHFINQRRRKVPKSVGGGGAHRHIIYVPLVKNHLYQFIEIVYKIINWYMKNAK